MKLILVACTATLLSACGGNDDDEPAAQPKTLVETAQSDTRFSILVEAVVAADLAGTLSAPGPFTVFAPTNDAFGGLLTATSNGVIHVVDKAILPAP